MSTTFIEKFLKFYDPLKIMWEMQELLLKYNAPSKFTIFEKIKKLYIKNIRYKLFKLKVKTMNSLVFKHLCVYPESTILIMNRYILAFDIFCKFFQISFDDFAEKYLNIGNMLTIDFDIDERKLDNNVLVFNIKGYNIITRYVTSSYEFIEDSQKPRYTISNLNIDLSRSIYEIRQTIYDTTDEVVYANSNIMHQRTFELTKNGTLYNPNYIFDESLKERDLYDYSYMITHIASAITEVYNFMIDISFISRKDIENEKNS